jgi:hypothetical protein
MESEDSFVFTGIKIDFNEKKNPPTASSIGYSNIDVLYCGFLASQI